MRNGSTCNKYTRQNQLPLPIMLTFADIIDTSRVSIHLDSTPKRGSKEGRNCFI